MLRLLGFAGVCFSFLFSSPVFAAQGTNLIGVSAASQGLGGTGVANYTNASDALYKNLGFLVEPTAHEGRVVGEFTLTVFGQSATSDIGLGAKDSQMKSKVSPSLAVLYQLDDKLALGLGVFSYGGALLDYTGELNHSQLKNELDLIKFVPAVAYRLSNEFSLGASPTLTYGAWALNSASTATPTVQSSRNKHGALGLGVQLGATARFVPNLIVGISYISKSKLNYKDIIDLDEFTATPAAGVDNVTIEQPQEIAMGVSYSVTPAMKLTVDYRNIGWSNAEGYKQFGWVNQNVIALGAQYSLAKLALRAGFNYAKSPIENATGEAGLSTSTLQGHAIFNYAISRLNMIAFPGIAESHITAGAGYDITDDFSTDLAFVYAPKVTRTRSGTFAPLISTANPTGAYALTTTVSQWSLSATAAYKF